MVRVLVVEDDESIGEAIAELLEFDGFTVFYTSDGIEALALMMQHSWDAVLLDLSLRQMTGEEILRRLQAADRLKDMSVIAMSTTPKRLQKLQAAGLVCVLDKPFEITDLDKAIESCLKIKLIPHPNGYKFIKKPGDLCDASR